MPVFAVAWVALISVSVLAGCGPIVPPSKADFVPSSAPLVALNIWLPIHPNTATNDALVRGTLQADGRCLFVVTPDGTRLGVAWPAGSRWDPTRTVITVKGVEAAIGQPVAIGGGSADVTLENINRTPWISRPRPECLGDGFIFAGSLATEAVPSTLQ